MSSTGSVIFSGSSRYASDFQQVYQRAISIASLPLQQLQQQESEFTSQVNALSSLDTRFTSLRATLDQVAQGISDAVQPRVSDTSVAQVSTQGSAAASSYTLDVISTGAYASSVSRDSAAPVQDPSSQSLTADATLTLSVGGVTYTITPAAGTMDALVRAINAANAGVRASVLNLGAPGAPDYRIALRSTTLGPVSISLSDSSGDLLGQLSAGALAQYRLNGLPSTPIQSTSRTITIAPGVTAELLSPGSTSIDLVPTSDKAESSLEALVAAYNAAVDEIDQHRGKSNGALRGQSIPVEASQVLQVLVSFQANGKIRSLSDLGVSLNQEGKLDFDATALQSAMADDPDAVSAFLGSTTSSGFLKAAADAIDAFAGSQGGTLQTAVDTTNDQIKKLQDRESDQQAQIDQLQQTLLERLTQADSQIAMLEQQVTMITGLFEAMKNNNSNN